LQATTTGDHTYLLRTRFPRATACGLARFTCGVTYFDGWRCGIQTAASLGRASSYAVLGGHGRRGRERGFNYYHILACRLLPHAGRYAMRARTKAVNTERSYFDGICNIPIPSAARASDTTAALSARSHCRVFLYAATGGMARGQTTPVPFYSVSANLVDGLFDSSLGYQCHLSPTRLPPHTPTPPQHPTPAHRLVASKLLPCWTGLAACLDMADGLPGDADSTHVYFIWLQRTDLS